MQTFRFALVPLVLALASCSQTITLVAESRTAIFTEDTTPRLLWLSWKVPDGITGFWKPTKNDLLGVENHLEEYLASVYAKRNYAQRRMPEWDTYYRQVGGIVWNGERQLFIAYSWAPWLNPKGQIRAKQDAEKDGRRYDPDWWKTEQIVVQDGGAMFFRVIFDPKKREFVWYDDNGGA